MIYLMVLHNRATGMWFAVCISFSCIHLLDMKWISSVAILNDSRFRFPVFFSVSGFQSPVFRVGRDQVIMFSNISLSCNYKEKITISKTLGVVELRYFRVFGLFFGFVVFYSRITNRWMFLLCCLDDGLIFEKSVSQTRLRSLFDKT